jgi:hypothetical protein
MVSVWLTCGLFAKYTISGSSHDLATVAKVGGVTVLEHEAIVQTDLDKILNSNSVYTLGSGTVSSNSYKAVSGTVIPKDTYIELDGTNDVACTLYIEIVDNSNNVAKFSIDTDGGNWSMCTDVISVHGGTVYKYTKTVSPHQVLTISNIIKDNTIRIKDTYTDKNDLDKNANFSIDFYAYLVQYD